MKTALITGITGQDGSYLTEFLLEKGYKVHGLVRRASTFNTSRIDHIIENREVDERFNWERGDLSDGNSIQRVLEKTRPDEIYHLAAQSHVKVSFENPIYTFDVVGTGSLRLFEAIKNMGLRSKVYNACSSEMFGAALPPQNEQTIFMPQSPYAVAKVASYYLAVNYRAAYGMDIYNGFLFNHESPRRGETFVTRKISRSVSRIAYGIEKKIELGNLDSKRDWGYAPEYVEAMWLMLQQDKPDDFVIATGESRTVREFVEQAFKHIGVEVQWTGTGLDEKAVVTRIISLACNSEIKINVGDVVVTVNPEFFRPTEVNYLLGDYKKANKVLGWRPKTTFKKLVEIMIGADLQKTEMILYGTRACKQEWRNFIM